MATYGKVKLFNPKVNDWEVYKEQLCFYMVVSSITDATKKRSILLTVCGEQTFTMQLGPRGQVRHKQHHLQLTSQTPVVTLQKEAVCHGAPVQLQYCF